MSSDAAMDVSNAVFQDEIAESLLGESTDSYAGNGEPETDRSGESEYDFDPIADSLVSDEQEDDDPSRLLEQTAGRFGERWEVSRQQDQEQAAEALPAPTPQAVEEHLAQIDQAVAEVGIDESAAKQLAYDLTAPYGADPSTLDAQGLGQFSGWNTIAAARVIGATQGDFSKIAPTPWPVVQKMTNDFCRVFGMDARDENVNSPRLSSALAGAHMNMVATALSRGLDRPVSELNDAEAAIFYVSELAQAVGHPAPSRAQCLKIADDYMKFVVNDLRRMQATPAREQQPSRRQSNSQRASRGSSRFQTNQDLFDDETLAAYAHEHGRL
jgi:hypothetical protein